MFWSCLKQETKILSDWFQQGVLSNDGLVGGFEIEGQILDRAFRPPPVNKEFFKYFNSPLASPELVSF